MFRKKYMRCGVLIVFYSISNYVKQILIFIDLEKYHFFNGILQITKSSESNLD